MILDFATLTGAARVALGTEVPAMFCNDDALADALSAAAGAVSDPFGACRYGPTINAI